jgi:molybdenum cofactor cytidylyltransferase
LIFGRVDLADEQAWRHAVLAHTQHVAGRVLAKGTRLDESIVRSLRAAGLAQVVAARLEPEDVAEDAAAARLGGILAGANMEAGPAQNGRVNLFAAASGLLRADRDAIAALNAVNEGITLATLPDAAPVSPGDLLATIKIIPFAVPRGALLRAVTQAAARAPLRLAPFQARRVGIVATKVRGLKESVIARAIAVTEARVTALGGSVLGARIVAHEEQAVAAALAGLLTEGAALLLVAGASATVDRSDEIPAAICRAGGVIEHFGMPVDPGNLLCFGHIGAVPALVLPGCARSPVLNGIDFCLYRLFSNETLDRSVIAGMGFGGLLKDFAGRTDRRGKPPALRDGAGDAQDETGRKAKSQA